MEEKTLNQLWFEVTGLLWDVESMLAQENITEEKLLWLIPDGSMLDFEGRKRSLTKELLSKLDVDDDTKFSTVEVETEEEHNNNTEQNNATQNNNSDPSQKPTVENTNEAVTNSEENTNEAATNSEENTNEPVTNSEENNPEP